MCVLCCEVGELFLCLLPWSGVGCLFTISRRPPLPPRPTIASRTPVDRELEPGRATQAWMG